MVVIDPTNSVRGQELFATRDVVHSIKHGQGRDAAHKLCLAYLNIGQAESYRVYWQPGWAAPHDGKPGTPDFLLASDPDGWEGNFPVAFWDPRWRQVLFGRPSALLDMILADGFDGVYLDWVLGYLEPKVVAEARRQSVDPAREMVRLIRDLAEYARARRPGFLVIAQNGVGLPDSDPSYYELIDGLAHEDVCFRGAATSDWNDPRSGGVRMDRGPDDPLVARLEEFRRRGVPVFTLDYALVIDQIRAAYSANRRRGFVPFVSRTPLDRLPDYLGTR